MSAQLAFDFDALTRQPYAGRAPLHFSTEFYTVDELGEAWDAWVEQNGHFDSIRVSHMWRASQIDTGRGTVAHDCCILSAALYCDHYQRKCFCVGSGLYRAQCDRCRWMAVGDESGAIEAWHDHAWPGWRELPRVPAEVRPGAGGITSKTKPAFEWVTANYPAEWQTDGAPVLTIRGGIGTRHVPGYSPWGGYDLAADRLEVAS